MSTAFVTDSRFEAHTMDGHPEYAGRLMAIQRALDEVGLTERFTCLDPEPATDESLLAVHTAAYLAQLEKTAQLTELAMLGVDTYVTPQSYAIACLAAGGVLRTVDVVMREEADNALAAIRPPGHHATSSSGMGFCLLNNIAIAARYAQRVYQVERVLIVDYDVHHGNGTQDIFYADPTVFYISTHQSPLYPGTGAMTEIGQAEGKGYTLNIPLPAGVGDVGYTNVFAELVLPAVRRFAPQLMLVSAGFDAHWADPLAAMRLSLTGFDQLSYELLAVARVLCEGRIVFVSEGGYNLQVLSNAWVNVGSMLLGDGEGERGSVLQDSLGPSYESEPSVDRIIERIKQIHKLF